MASAAEPADTTPDSYRLLVELWRSMTVYDRAALLEQLCVDVELFARAAISARYPQYTDSEICHELARRRYGDRLADAAYSGLLPHR